MPIIVTWNGTAITFEYGMAMSTQKEFVRGDDGSVLHEKHVINIRGEIVATGSTPEDRYRNLMTKMFSATSKIVGGANRTTIIQAGVLTIDTSDNSGIIAQYESATLTSATVADPPEDTAGIHTQEVSFTFEAINTLNDQFTDYKLKSVSESIDLKREENGYSYLTDDITEDEPYHSYTITHSITAQGMINNGSTKAEAFNEAYKYVNTKGQNTLAVITKDVFGNDFLSGDKLNPVDLSVNGASSIIVDSAIQSYGQYNRVRTASSDVTSGSYSMTTTFYLSREQSNIDFTANYTRDEGGESSITIDGTVQGLSKKGVTDVRHDKITQARITYSNIAGDLGPTSKIYQYADSVYSVFHMDQACTALRSVPIAYSNSENKNAGTISFSVSYKVISSALNTLLSGITNALVASASIADNNRTLTGLDAKQIVEIPIPGRQNGPIYQDMGTYKSRRRSVVVDVTLNICGRTLENDLVRTEVITALEGYKPPSYTDLYVDSFDEQWDWTSGKYTANLAWIYTP